MLSPDTRKVAFELLRPPPDYVLDFALLTTYTLDIEALLGLPLSVLAKADKGLEDLLSDPLLLLEALRQSSDRIHVFVDRTGIGVPSTNRELYTILEPSIHPVCAPGGGTFHPKVWILRFIDETDTPRLRLAVLSRNLTFDRSWDIALVSEGSPKPKRQSKASQQLAQLIRRLPDSDFCEHQLEKSVSDRVYDLADEISRTSFPAPDGFFNDPLMFHVLGLSGHARLWRPMSTADRTLAVAPFVNRTALDAIVRIGSGERILVSSVEALNNLQAECHNQWHAVFILDDAAHGEDDDGSLHRLTGLHAKMLAFEHGWDVTWFVGSANMTAAAFSGNNVEVMASMTARKGRKEGIKGMGIDRFFQSGFEDLCVMFHPEEDVEDDSESAETLQRLEATQDALLDLNLKVICQPSSDNWSWTLAGNFFEPSQDIEVTVWPISLPEEQSRPLTLPLNWTLPPTMLTSLVGFRLHAIRIDVDDITFTMALPSEGMPSDRMHDILRNLIGDSKRFLDFLRILLGGLEGTVDWPGSPGKKNGDGSWIFGGTSHNLLEDLIRATSRNPMRLDPVRRLIDDLRTTRERSGIIPPDFLKIWDVVNEVIQTDDTQ